MEKKKKDWNCLDHKRIFCSTKGKKKCFHGKPVEWTAWFGNIYWKKNYFVLSLPFSLFFKGVFLIKSSNDAAKTDIFKNKWGESRIPRLKKSGFIIICFNTHKRGFVLHNLKTRQTGSITGLFKQISLLTH